MIFSGNAIIKGHFISFSCFALIYFGVAYSATKTQGNILGIVFRDEIFMYFCENYLKNSKISGF